MGNCSNLDYREPLRILLSGNIMNILLFIYESTFTNVISVITVCLFVNGLLILQKFSIEMVQY